MRQTLLVGIILLAAGCHRSAPPAPEPEQPGPAVTSAPIVPSSNPSPPPGSGRTTGKDGGTHVENPPPQPKPMSYWIEQLSRPEPGPRIEAIRALAKFGPTAATAVPTLAGLLHEEAAGPEAKAALLKIDPGFKGTLTALSEQLKDPEVDRRKAAAKVLGELEGVGKAAIPALAAAVMVDEDAAVRATARESLAKLDPQSARSYREFTIGFVPPIESDPMLECRAGAVEACRHLRGKLIYSAPEAFDSQAQKDLIEKLAGKIDPHVMIVDAPVTNAVAPALEALRKKGVIVVAVEFDPGESARDVFVRRVSDQDMAEALADAAADSLKARGEGKIAVLTGPRTVAPLGAWADAFKTAVMKKHPKMDILKVAEHNFQVDKARAMARDLIQTNPGLRAIVALDVGSLRAAAEAVLEAGKKGEIAITGVAPPVELRRYGEDVVTSVVCWKSADLGYLAAQAGAALARKQLPADGTFEAGRLGKFTLQKGEVTLGKPTRYTKEDFGTPK
jgi:rhamnose transport system substrate-binding protein